MTNIGGSSESPAIGITLRKEYKYPYLGSGDIKARFEASKFDQSEDLPVEFSTMVTFAVEGSGNITVESELFDYGASENRIYGEWETQEQVDRVNEYAQEKVPEASQTLLMLIEAATDSSLNPHISGRARSFSEQCEIELNDLANFEKTTRLTDTNILSPTAIA